MFLLVNHRDCNFRPYNLQHMKDTRKCSKCQFDWNQWTDYPILVHEDNSKINSLNKNQFWKVLKEISSILQSGSLSTFVKIRLKIACRMFSDLSCCFRPAGSAQKFYWSKLLVRWIHVPNHTFQKSKKNKLGKIHG